MVDVEGSAQHADIARVRQSVGPLLPGLPSVAAARDDEALDRHAVLVALHGDGVDGA